MEFIQLNSGKMLNMNTVTLVSLQYNCVVYDINSGKSIYEEFKTPEEAQDRYSEVGAMILA